MLTNVIVWQNYANLQITPTLPLQTQIAEPPLPPLIFFTQILIFYFISYEFHIVLIAYKTLLVEINFQIQTKAPYNLVISLLVGDTIHLFVP